MKEILIKAFWPQIAVGVLLVVLGALTLLSRGAKRGSRGGDVKVHDEGIAQRPGVGKQGARG